VHRSGLAPLTVALALVAAPACAPRIADGSPREVLVAAGSARFRIVHAPADADAARQVADALRVAAPRVERWGGLVRPVTVTIHPSHAALERAVSRPGYRWLRAWARYATIDLQSPRTWGLFGGGRARVEELLTHELAHCAMYQRAGDEVTWMYKGIPRWFTEGLASHTAEQGRRHGGLAPVARSYAEARARGRADPLEDSEALYLGRSEVVYGASHHAFVFLLARYGEPRVRRVLDLMGEGRRFSSAFREAIGIGDAEFAAEFRRYVLWEGWRR
jgi:hypothetical protein